MHDFAQIVAVEGLNTNGHELIASKLFQVNIENPFLFFRQGADSI